MEAKEQYAKLLSIDSNNAEAKEAYRLLTNDGKNPDSNIDLPWLDLYPPENANVTKDRCVAVHDGVSVKF